MRSDAATARLVLFTALLLTACAEAKFFGNAPTFGRHRNSSDTPTEPQPGTQPQVPSENPDDPDEPDICPPEGEQPTQNPGQKPQQNPQQNQARDCPSQLVEER
jgi:hypothetical protein